MKPFKRNNLFIFTKFLPGPYIESKYEMIRHQKLSFICSYLTSTMCLGSSRCRIKIRTDCFSQPEFVKQRPEAKYEDRIKIRLFCGRFSRKKGLFSNELWCEFDTIDVIFFKVKRFIMYGKGH